MSIIWDARIRKAHSQEFADCGYLLRTRELTRLSSRGRQIIVEGSGHMILQEAPDAVIKAIREVVEEVRAEQV